jgi:undecaprenyl diphosphate synthase
MPRGVRVKPFSRSEAKTQPGPPSQSGPAGRKLHVAIIMDGNGRWAKARGLPRTLGHRSGVNALKRTVEAAPEFGVDRLTVFGFSTENWRRPAHEVSELMSLLKTYLESDLTRLEREGARVRVLGRRTGLAPDIQEIIERAESRTAANDRFHLQVAFNYGARADITDAAQALARAVREGRLDPEAIDEAAFEAELSTAEDPAPDLIIRTSGEQRLSNFLLWESAYAELVFQDVLWPDYGPAHLKAAVDEFRGRDRRYGGADVDDVLATG